MPTKKIVKKTPITINKIPTVTVETKRLSQDCCSTTSSSCCSSDFMNSCGFRLLIIILLLLNSVLSIFVLSNQRSIEAMRVWWTQNYKMLKEVFNSDWFKTQQAQQINQALQMYKGSDVQTQDMQIPSDVEVITE